MLLYNTMISEQRNNGWLRLGTITKENQEKPQGIKYSDGDSKRVPLER